MRSIFKGKLEYIHAVRDAVKLPVLRKDFIIDPYQVYEVARGGADAILLIAECLETSQMIDLQILATELRMTCLIEVHDMDNLMRVRDHVIGFPHRSYSLLGINNRDLKTFKVDLGNYAAAGGTGRGSFGAGQRKRHSEPGRRNEARRGRSAGGAGGRTLDAKRGCV